MKSKEEKLFYERHIPEIIKQISRLAEAMEKQNSINEKLLLLEKKKFLADKNISESLDKSNDGKEK